jgi:hypothetical protein
MRSHTYDFSPGDILRLVGPTFATVAAGALLLHGLTALNALPSPRPTLDVDRTIIIHKAEASGSRDSATVVLLGDSSCLIDVSATQLSEGIGDPVLNLGTLSYLDLNAHTVLLKWFVSANPGQLKAVVLLLHPDALRRHSAEAYHTAVLENFLAGEDHITKRNASYWLGLEFFRGRVLSRLLPAPLPKAYGRRYGFSSDLEAHLKRERGSAVDPDPKDFQGSPEYRLAPQLEIQSRAFKAVVPPGAKLFVGITPVPGGFAPPNYPELHREMLLQWSEWLGADALTDLPATSPDELFAKTTHLNERGAAEYTTLLARALSRRLTR